MKRRKSLLLVLLVVVLLYFTYRYRHSSFECTDAIGCVTIAPGQPIKLSLLLAFSGKAGHIGNTQGGVLELVFSRINNKLLNHPIEIVKEDSACSSEVSRIAALKIVADHQMIGTLGTTCSGAATTAGKVISEAGLVMISGSNAAPNLTSISGEKKGSQWQSGYFRSIPNGAGQGRSAAVFAYRQLGITRAATINDGDAFTRSITALFEKTFTDLGGKITLSTKVTKGDLNMEPVMTAMANFKADLIFMPLFQSEAELIVKEVKKIAALKETVLIGAGALRSDKFIHSIGENGKGMHFVISDPPRNIELEALLAEYDEKYGETPKHPVYGFNVDAASLMFSGITTAVLHEEDGTLYIGRQALRDALYAIRNFKGIAAVYNCNQWGDCNDGNYMIVRLDNPLEGVAGLLKNIVFSSSSINSLND